MTTSTASRRQFLTGLAAGATALALPNAHAKDAAPKWHGYGRATVIDALGGPGSANKPGKDLDAADLADVRASGVTAVNLTV
ncbi:MAG TPA: twin-arginine translocation signal domain-containing protein, partial [Rhodanobacteraceae bacterium]